ncbi:ArsR/SmtB family transcription factor [Natronosalvus caseinilyticus]|uniref:ArsR/SmtB family transcription factor n=1 Tax=Natronosalvus caseinilyticus TaxID=2953747 RepID=UPI0028B24EC3|nr:winged helix-turn-helix domain-containing protein [Natronosalvus caseinilyticus]
MDTGSVEDGPAPSDAFQALGNEIRMRTVRTLLADGPCTFSELFEASGTDTSAGFAYHLRQLTGEFVRQREDDRYELTYAGREVGRAVQAGTYTDSVDHESISLPEPCPFCEETELVATVTDNVSRVACRSCDAPILELSFPPSGYATRGSDSIPTALDAYHRHRIRTFADGVCPDCGGATTVDVEPVVGTTDEEADGPDRVQLAFDCEACGASLRCPVTLAVLEHPAVVSFYHEHDSDVRERSLWNVGREWRERVVSSDPWCLLVRTRLEDETLLLYVSGDGTVVDSRRRPITDDDARSDAGSVADANEPSTAEDDERQPALETDSSDESATV